MLCSRCFFNAEYLAARDSNRQDVEFLCRHHMLIHKSARDPKRMFYTRIIQRGDTLFALGERTPAAFQFCVKHGRVSEPIPLYGLEYLRHGVIISRLYWARLVVDHLRY